MSRPLVLTSPNNALAIGLLLVLVLTGGVFVVNPSIYPPLYELLGFFISLWGLGMVVVGLTTTVAVAMAPHVSRPARYLRVEMFGTLVLALLLAVYPVALLVLGVGPLSQFFYFGLCVCILLRTFQVWRELKKLDAAVRLSLTATQEALADPTKEE